MYKAAIAITLAIVAYLAFMGAALAGNAVSPGDESMLDLAKPAFDAIMSGNGWLGAALALIFVVTAVKRYASKIPVVGPKIEAFANGQYGQPLSVLLLAFAGALATALAAGGTMMSAGLALTALKVALTAAGGYSLLKALLVPVLQKLGTKAPAWMKPLFDVLMWAFSKPTSIEKAEKAGADAVAATPTDGAPKSDIAEL